MSTVWADFIDELKQKGSYLDDDREAAALK